MKNNLFDAFWEIYPRKVNKKEAKAQWSRRLKQGHDPEEIIQAAQNYVDICKKENVDRRYILHPEAFISFNVRWKEYLKEEGGEKDEDS